MPCIIFTVNDGGGYAGQSRYTNETEFFSALERGEAISQAALSERLSVSVGFVNILLRRTIRKGWARARVVPQRRWAYFLTPRGVAEKSRLVATYLENSLAFFREAREGYVRLFAEAKARGVHDVVLIGSGELAEIALLAAREAEVMIVGIVVPEANVEWLYGLSVLRHPNEAGAVAALAVTDSCQPQAVFDSIWAQYGARMVLTPALLHICRRDEALPDRISEAGR